MIFDHIFPVGFIKCFWDAFRMRHIYGLMQSGVFGMNGIRNIKPENSPCTSVMRNFPVLWYHVIHRFKHLLSGYKILFCRIESAGSFREIDHNILHLSIVLQNNLMGLAANTGFLVAAEG